MTMLLADAAMGQSYPTNVAVEYSFCEPPRRVIGATVQSGRPSPSIHFRHGGIACVAWLDGHVSAEKMSFTRTTNDYGADDNALDIGWFGPDNNSLFDNK